MPIEPAEGVVAWFLPDEINPELAEARKGLSPAGTADKVFVADLVFGTEDLREDGARLVTDPDVDKLEFDPA